MFLINKHKRLVVVNEADVPQALLHGCSQVFFDDFYPKIDLTNKTVLFHRNGGGLGDLICLLPAIEAIAFKAKKISLAIIPEYNCFYDGTFNQVKNIDLINISVFTKSYLELKDKYDYVIDLFCPCGIHEGENKYRPAKGRIENFANALQTEPVAPAIFAEPHPSISSTKQKVLIQLKTNNVTKDWPLENFQKLGESLQKLGIYVVTIDAKTRLKNIPCIKGKELKDIPSYVAAFDLVVGCDSGIMHMAAALGIPTLWLFGATSAELTIPYYSSADALSVSSSSPKVCHSPCYYYSEGNKFHCKNRVGECMHHISVTQVFKTAITKLDGNNS